MDRREFTKLVCGILFAPLAIPKILAPKRAGNTIPAGTLMCYTDDTRTAMRPVDSRFGDTMVDIIGCQTESGLVRKGLVYVRVVCG